MKRQLVTAILFSAAAASPAFAQYTLTTLATFNYDITGSVPGTLTADSSGNLYGATTYGGPGPYPPGLESVGSVFEFTKATQSLNTQGTFYSTPDLNPADIGAYADYLTSVGLVGTTAYGGSYGDGQVFSASGGVVSTLATFTGVNGAFPSYGVIAFPGGLYGTTAQGGLNNDGVVYAVSGGMLNDVATFNGANGANPSGGLTQAGGNLYGVTRYGGDLSLNNGAAMAPFTRSRATPRSQWPRSTAPTDTPPTAPWPPMPTETCMAWHLYSTGAPPTSRSCSRSPRERTT